MTTVLFFFYFVKLLFFDNHVTLSNIGNSIVLQMSYRYVALVQRSLESLRFLFQHVSLPVLTIDSACIVFTLFPCLLICLFVCWCLTMFLFCFTCLTSFFSCLKYRHNCFQKWKYRVGVTCFMMAHHTDNLHFNLLQIFT